LVDSGASPKDLASPLSYISHILQAGDLMLDFLREPEEPPELFFSLVDDGMHGLIRFAALNAASTLHLFDHLEKGPVTLHEVSQATGIDEGRLFPLLGVLLTAGVMSAQKVSTGTASLHRPILFQTLPTARRAISIRMLYSSKRYGPAFRNDWRGNL
jgi:hypothetical protein